VFVIIIISLSEHSSSELMPWRSVRHPSVNFSHFELLLKNGWRDLLQSCHKCSLWGPDQVLLLFKPIRSPIWLLWPLIGWHILNFFSRTAEGIYSKRATHVPYEILTTCCYYLNGSKSIVVAVASDWLTYKKLIISFCFKFRSGIYK